MSGDDMAPFWGARNPCHQLYIGGKKKSGECENKRGDAESKRVTTARTLRIYGTRSALTASTDAFSRLLSRPAGPSGAPEGGGGSSRKKR